MSATEPGRVNGWTGVTMTHDDRGEDGQRWQVFEATLVEACAAIGVAVGADQRGMMVAHYARMIEANRQFNLTRITEPAEAAVKHYADSLTLLASPWVDALQPLRVLDVGTGAGLPAVPLAIVCPAWEVTAIDGTGKKTGFVAETAAVLGLGNLRTQHIRAGDLARKGGARRFDLVLLRAVGMVAKGLTEVERLVAPGGAAVFYKTPSMSEDEVRNGEATAGRVGLGCVATFETTLPLGDEAVARRLIRYSAVSGR